MDIYQEIVKDHREIRNLLHELIELDRNDEYRFLLIPEVCNAISSHARAEEAVLYHCLSAHEAHESREAKTKRGKAAKVAISSIKDHIEIETTLILLKFMDRLGANWKPSARKLLKLVDGHLRHEENVVFDTAKKVFTAKEAKKMGQVYKSLKPAMSQKGELRVTAEMALQFLEAKIPGRISGVFMARG